MPQRVCTQAIFAQLFALPTAAMKPIAYFSFCLEFLKVCRTTYNRSCNIPATDRATYMQQIMQHGYNIAPLCVLSRVAKGWLCTAGDSLRVMLCCVVWAVRHCMLVLMHLGFHICARCHAHMPLHLACCAAFHSIPVLTALDSSAPSARLDRLAFDSLRKSERVSAPKLPAGAPAVRPDLDLHQSALEYSLD